MIPYNDELLSPLDYLKEKCLESVKASTWGSNTPMYAIQGEIFGEGIQNNPLNVKGQKFLIFNFIKDGWRLTKDSAVEEFDNIPNNTSLVVPIHNVKIPDTLEELIKSPDKVSSLVEGSNCKQIEGFVWRNKNRVMAPATSIYIPYFSFKTVSNEYLLLGHE